MSLSGTVVARRGQQLDGVPLPNRALRRGRPRPTSKQHLSRQAGLGLTCFSVQGTARPEIWRHRRRCMWFWAPAGWLACSAAGTLFPRESMCTYTNRTSRFPASIACSKFRRDLLQRGGNVRAVMRDPEKMQAELHDLITYFPRGKRGRLQVQSCSAITGHRAILQRPDRFQPNAFISTMCRWSRATSRSPRTCARVRAMLGNNSVCVCRSSSLFHTQRPH